VNLYVGGAGTIQLSMGGRIDGLLHAPEAELVLGAGLEIVGHALVRRVGVEFPLTVTTP
jgi:hypothetical protein